MSNTRHPPFFIVGAQRSGTTLLRLILNAHSSISIPEEARFLMPFLKRKNVRSHFSGKRLQSAINYLRGDKQFRQWNFDSEPLLRALGEHDRVSVRDIMTTLYGGFAAHENKPSWGDKSLFFRKIEILADIFPEARFIHMVRDGRDVFDSWRKMDASKGNVAATALDWRYKLTCIEKSFARLAPQRKATIRYEDLLADTTETVTGLCDFLGISFEEEMLNFHRSSQYYIGKHHSELIFRSIDSNNRYKWKRNISRAEAVAFEIISRNKLVKYGYELTGDRSTVKDITYVAGRLATGIPYRAFSVVRERLLADYSLRRGTAYDKSTGEMPELRK